MQITVKDLKEFLASFDDATPVELDKDGWLDEEIPHQSAQELIKKRGVFYRSDQSKFGGSIVLIINN